MYVCISAYQLFVCLFIYLSTNVEWVFTLNDSLYSWKWLKLKCIAKYWMWKFYSSWTFKFDSDTKVLLWVIMNVYVKKNKQKVKILWHLIHALKHIVFISLSKRKKGQRKIRVSFMSSFKTYTMEWDFFLVS